MKEQVAEIVAAYLRKNSVAPSDIPTVITQVYQSLGAALGRSPVESPETPKPAVPIRRSVADEFVICLECGARGVMLRRHLNRVHSLTPGEYRHRWRLPASHPLTAPNYTARRSEIAKSYGLGTGQTAAKRGVVAPASDPRREPCSGRAPSLGKIPQRPCSTAGE